jgi:hypothetical protein
MMDDTTFAATTYESPARPASLPMRLEMPPLFFSEKYPQRALKMAASNCRRMAVETLAPA